MNHKTLVSIETLESQMISAILSYDLPAIINLVHEGANPNLMFATFTPLYVACKENNYEVAHELLLLGATAVEPDVSEPYLSIAAGLNSVRLLDILMQFGARDEDGMAFRTAAVHGHVEILSVLLETHRSYELLRELKEDLEISYAISKAHPRTLKYLLQNDRVIDWTMEHKWALFLKIASLDNEKLWQALVGKEWFGTLHDSIGNAPLASAVLNNSCKRLLRILGTQADLDHVNQQGQTALHHAVGSSFCTLILLIWGAKPDVQDHEGNTPMLLSILQKMFVTTCYLLDQGASPSICNFAGLSPLMAAISQGPLETITINGIIRNPRFILDPGLYESAREALLERTDESKWVIESAVQRLDAEYLLRSKLGLLIMARRFDESSALHPNNIPEELSCYICSLAYFVMRR